MSKKAEEKALEAYPGPTRDKTGFVTFLGFPQWYRDLFIQGFEQAEKDLGWVSVKDRLPEEDGWYFTCVEQFKIPQCVGITYYYKKTGLWYNDIPIGKRTFMSTIEIVEYWMPIPKLPKED